MRVWSLWRPGLAGVLALLAGCAAPAPPGHFTSPVSPASPASPASPSSIQSSSPTSPGPRVSALAVEQELERLAAGRTFWPGFDPLAIPLALFDGENTWLFRHPQPPPEFGPGQGGGRIADGRPESLRANTGTVIAGVPTATVLLDAAPGTPPKSIRAWAAIALHEAFHVFAKGRYPSWGGDEMELFVYPVDAVAPLALRREETLALRHALAAPDPAGAAGWARAALALRAERFALLPPGAVAYERGTELNEGLAHYVEGLARGEEVDLPADGFPAEKVRERAYPVGRTLATLLDRLTPTGAPDWKVRLGSPGQPASLDELLAATLPASPGPPVASVALSAAEIAFANRCTVTDIERLARERRGARAAFLAQPGWTVIVVAPGEPLWPQAFDPLNVLRLSSTEVLHRRWLKLGNASAAIEVLDRAALTAAVGPHPLFQGVRELRVTGLPAKPEVRELAGVARLDLAGFTAKLKHATVEVSGHEVRIRLAGRPTPDAASAPAQPQPGAG